MYDGLSSVVVKKVALRVTKSSALVKDLASAWRSGAMYSVNGRDWRIGALSVVRSEALIGRGEGRVQLFAGIGVFDDLRDSCDHLVEFGAAGRGEALCVGLLQEPEFLEGDDCVTAGDFEGELRGLG